MIDAPRPEHTGMRIEETAADVMVTRKDPPTIRQAIQQTEWPSTIRIPIAELGRLRQNTERWEMALRNPFLLLDQAKGMRFAMTTSEKATAAVDAAIAAEKAK